MEGLITSDLNGKVFKIKTDLGECQIHVFRIFWLRQSEGFFRMFTKMM